MGYFVVAHADPATTDDTGQTLEEVVVTAQKFSQRLQDVPITVTELSQADLTKANVVTAYDLPSVVSGLVWTNEGAWVMPALRGVSTNIAAVGASPPVAIYVDGVYQADTADTIMDLPDINKIEVNKGPQGTLFGRNATGGAISIYTLDPSFTPTAKVSLTTGVIGGGSAQDSGHYNLSGFVGGPLIGDTLAGSLSAYYNFIDGYFTNDADGDRGGRVENENVRGKILWKPGEGISILFTGYYAHRDDGAAIAGVPFNGVTAASFYPPAIIPTQPWHYAYNGPTPEILNNTRSGSVKATFDLDAGTLVNTAAYTSYLNSVYLTGHAADAPQLCLVYFACVQAYITSPESAWSEELDFNSKQLGQFHYTAGLFVFSQDAREHDSYNPTTSTPYTDDSLMRIRSYAAFGEGYYDITDALQAIAGLRVTHETLKADGSLYGEAFQPYADAGWTSTTPRASLLYKINPVVNTYFTFSEGFKGGVASGQYVGNSTTPPANPEKLFAYEVGVKAAQSHYRLNVAAFYYKYEDLQVESLINHGFTTVPQNAAKAEIYGLDVDGTLKWNDSFETSLDTTYLPRAEYKSFPDAIVYLPPMTPFGYTEDGHFDASGTRMLAAPLWTGTISATYTKTLATGVFQATPSLYYSSSYRWDYAGLIQTAAYNLVNARLSFTPTSSNFHYSLYGKNLTNRAYFNGVTPGPGTAVSFYGQPREVGLTIDYAF